MALTIQLFNKKMQFYIDYLLTLVLDTKLLWILLSLK